MPQAVRLTSETVSIVATKTDQSVKDVQAMLEYHDSLKETVYVVFDLTVTKDLRIVWTTMRKPYFDENFMFPYGENVDKFQPIVHI